MEMVLLAIKIIAIKQSLNWDTHMDDIPIYRYTIHSGSAVIKEIKTGGNEIRLIHKVSIVRVPALRILGFGEITEGIGTRI